MYLYNTIILDNHSPQGKITTLILHTSPSIYPWALNDQSSFLTSIQARKQAERVSMKPSNILLKIQ